MTLRLQEVSKTWDTAVGLHPTTLALAPGEAVLLRGDNGAGKSTLLGLAAGLLRPTSGQVTLDGRPLAAARAHLGYLPEGPRFEPRQTVARFLRFCADLSDGSPTETARRLAIPLDARLGTLSRGVRQRVGIAQAVLHAPAVLLLDEPLTALDESTRRLVVSVLHEEKARGAALLVASHHPQAFGDLFDRVAHIANGALAWA